MEILTVPFSGMHDWFQGSLKLMASSEKAGPWLRSEHFISKQNYTSIKHFYLLMLKGRWSDDSLEGPSSDCTCVGSMYIPSSFQGPFQPAKRDALLEPGKRHFHLVQRYFRFHTTSCKLVCAFSDA